PITEGPLLQPHQSQGGGELGEDAGIFRQGRFHFPKVFQGRLGVPLGTKLAPGDEQPFQDGVFQRSALCRGRQGGKEGGVRRLTGCRRGRGRGRTKEAPLLGAYGRATSAL